MAKPTLDEEQPQPSEPQPIIPPPCSMQVDHERKPVLFTADGKALVRRCGF